MSEPTAADIRFIDSMALAYEAFLGCRHLYEGTDALLHLHGRVLALARERDSLIVAVPARWVGDIDPYFQREIEVPPETVRSGADLPPPVGSRLFRAVEVGASEMQRLWPLRASAAIRSLGYAFHPLPNLVRSGERFDPGAFGFCFRIAAFCWDDLSRGMQEELCSLAGIDRPEAERRMAEPGFSIDMFGHARTEQR